MSIQKAQKLALTHEKSYLSTFPYFQKRIEKGLPIEDEIRKQYDIDIFTWVLALKDNPENPSEKFHNWKKEAENLFELLCPKFIPRCAIKLIKKDQESKEIEAIQEEFPNL